MKTYTEPYGNTRIWLKTIRKLRLLRGLTDESTVAILERLVEQEVKRVQQEQQNDKKQDA